MKISNHRTCTILVIILLLSFPLLGASYVWLPLETPEGYEEFELIDNFGEDLVWAACNSILYTTDLIKSVDGGKNWEFQYTFPTIITDLEFIDANTGFATTSGKIYKTANGGESWTELNIGVSYSLTQLEVLSENVIWASANRNYLIKTTDGGSTWSTDTLSTVNRDILDISVLDNDRAWAVLKNTQITDLRYYLYVTADGGENWSQKYSGYDAISDVEMTAINTGFAYFDGWIRKTTDDASSWSSSKMDQYNDYRFYSLNNDNIWAFTDEYSSSGKIYRTIDGGDTWESSGNGYGTSLSGLYDFCSYDTSDAWVSNRYRIFKHVLSPELELLFPNAGDNLNTGESAEITWHAETIDYINIYYTLNGSDWLLIEDSVEASTGSYNWQVSTSPASQCKIKLEPCEELFNSMTTESDGYFSIVKPPIGFVDVDLYEECEFSEANPLNVFSRDLPIRLKVKVKNNLTQNLLSASGTLSTSSPYISFSSNSSSYNNILVNSEEWSSNEFEFTISNSAPDEFIVEFELELNDQIVTGGPWTTQFSLPVILNPFEIGLVLIDDDNNPDSQGDNDDVVDPGEHVEIIPLLNNVSNNEYDNVEGELFSLTDEIEIWDFISGASGVVYSKYPYNVVSGSQEIVDPLQSNIMPEQDFVLTYNYIETFTFQLIMQITADVPKYDNMEMRWTREFTMNESYPVVGLMDILPKEYSLSNYPNPLNPTTTISYDLPEAQNITFQIYDITGRLVETLYSGYKEAGHWDTTWNASNHSSGVYIYRLQVRDQFISKKMVVLK